MSCPRDLRRARLSLAILCFLPACTLLPPIDFQRMIYQDRFQVWQRCAYFRDGRVLQTPPEGTIPRGEPLGETARITGMADGGFVDEVPLPVTRALLVTGEARFDTFCAACHGLRGDGVSVVAANMDLRKPPALTGPTALQYETGRIYQAIDQGYGLMRSYQEDLTSPEERWAVVAYLRVLQLSQAAKLDDLPPDVRQEAERQLR
jgi:mono/diheme cytochrome c family protein